jgi:RHS repeat-associated protein
LAAEYSSQVVSGVGTQYLHVDHLGSTRLVVNANGAPVTSGCHDFRPFGQELLAGTNGRSTPCFPSAPASSLEFTGKERDGETGFDYFGARYLSAAQGRFTSVDPQNIVTEASGQDEFAAFVGNPQNWNRYAYVLNNPMSMTDPDGRCPSCLIWVQQIAMRAAPYFNRAAIAAQQYSTQIYLAATRFFNSPAGQEATASVAELVTGSQLPYGFANAAQFQKFGNTISTGLREVAGEGVQAFLAGSAITGKSFRTGVAFDVGRQSDFDVALVGKKLLDKAKGLGIELRGKGTRTGPLDPKDLRALGLDGLQQRLSGMAGRTVSFMIYESEEALRVRGAPYQGLQ